ncbi:Pseudouridine synthase [Moritella viscosa]|uniref:Pseudouridine synthase n=1 Tax=Moritella viscosa TaxID=80854 RepID=A0A090IAP1_9GAMM|nr:23S rRNA pseudouridine(2605) synthase RluB [Moritella viscosa]CED59070.1 pseudouridine synthase [Moritella viscosa]SGZ07207.1 Pseudouridine synthase [Moritella viscosa]SGZ08283.1 Pseudouridine synthase [Moritella viscosa]SGZ17140.1 Pseudouridine synthase [Moritella viscosa]SHN99138.1 Pseudouridine synthase [Moritella viscosa]
MSEKLQKVLARAGLGSRREMEAVIAEGRVSVNGDIVTLGSRVEEADKIRFDGNPVSVIKEEDAVCRILAYHKPEGELCTRKDPEGRKTVFDRLPPLKSGRWIAIGRLDINTSGLLLFTTDGELANRLMHPSHEVEREYSCRIFGEVTPKIIQNLRMGVELEDGPAKFQKIKGVAAGTGGEGLNQWYNVLLSEGRNREVRRLWESQGIQVSRLIRIRYGSLVLDRRLPRGGWSELALEEINYLRTLVSLDPETTARSLERKETRIRQGRIRRSLKNNDARQKPTKSGRLGKEIEETNEPRGKGRTKPTGSGVPIHKGKKGPTKQQRGPKAKKRTRI